MILFFSNDYAKYVGDITVASVSPDPVINLFKFPWIISHLGAAKTVMKTNIEETKEMIIQFETIQHKLSSAFETRCGSNRTSLL
jgi:hypothetical protein